MEKKEGATKLKSQSAKIAGNKSVQRSNFEETMFQKNLFLGMALDMTWQLALVVIVPIVGGYMLDQHYHTAPWLTLAGMAVAAIGVFGVLSRVVNEANRRSGYGKPKGKA